MSDNRTPQEQIRDAAEAAGNAATEAASHWALSLSGLAHALAFAALHHEIPLAELQHNLGVAYDAQRAAMPVVPSAMPLVTGREAEALLRHLDLPEAVKARFRRS